MSAITRTERGRVGTALIAAGALLLALASVMIIGQSPVAAEEHECFPAWPGLNPAANNGNNTISGTIGGVFTQVSIIHTGTNEVFTWQVIQPAGGSIDGQYVQQGTTYFFSGNSGTVTPPSANAAINHVQICDVTPLEEETTTTTVAEETTTTTVAEETTTTTVAGVEEPTTTLAPEEPTTTVVAGPADPELPETGAGHILALMAGGLGLALMGSGSLVIAGERRRSIVL
jgi:hypothetical protein